MKNWYVLYVLTGKEERLAEKINGDQNLNLSAFIPKKKRYFRQRGVASFVDEILFPGYVFIESDLAMDEFSILVSQHIKNKSGIIKLLGDKKDHEYISVSSKEQQWLKQFVNKDNVINVSQGFIEGDQIVITAGPLMGQESQIIKVDRHKRKVMIEVTMFNNIRTISLPCEIVSKR